MSDAFVTFCWLVAGWFLGILSEPVKDGLFGPKLKVLFDPANNIDMHYTLVSYPTGSFAATIPVFFVRLRVRNVGRLTARNAEVIVASVSKRHDGTGVFEPDAGFVPLNLKWSNLDAQFTAIPYRIERHIDLCCLYPPRGEREEIFFHRSFRRADDDQVQVALETTVRPHTCSDLLPCGEYQIELVAVSDNAAPETVTIRAEFPTKWSDSDLRSHVKLTGLSPRYPI